MEKETALDVSTEGGGIGDAGGEIPVLSPAVGKSTMTSKLTISGSGLKFERQVADSVIVRIIQLVLTGEDAGSQVASTRGTRSDLGGRKESIAEFFRRVNPTNNSEKLTTIATYLQETAGRRSFTPDDLRSQFRAVNEPPPANLPRDFKEALGKGWIAEEHDAPGQHYVTQSGLDSVAASFAASAPRRGGKGRRKKRNAKANVNEVPAESGE